MEDVLEVYHRPHDPEYPVVCVDETSKQLISETRVPIKAKPGQPARHDYEYERNGYSVDFVDDIDLSTQNRLRDYQVIYVTQPNISQAAQRTIGDWVSNGGTLVATPGAGFWNEYNTPLSPAPSTLLDVLGLKAPTSSAWELLRKQVDILGHPIVGQFESLGAASGMSSSWSESDPRNTVNARIRSTGSAPQLPCGAVRFLAAPLLPVNSADVIAEFANACVTNAVALGAAITSHKHGRGTAIAYGFLPGTEYFASQEQLAPSQLPTHWDAEARIRAVFPMLQATGPVPRPVYANVPLVEALRLDDLSKGTIGVVLLNWNDWTKGQQLLPVTVFIAGAAGKTVTSVEVASPTTWSIGPDLYVALYMKNSDILVVQ
jgi:hypothetical protein